MPLPPAWPPEQIGTVGNFTFPEQNDLNSGYSRLRLTGGKVALFAVDPAIPTPTAFDLYVYDPVTNTATFSLTWEETGFSAPMLVENGTGFRIIAVNSTSADIVFRDFDADGTPTAAKTTVATGLNFPELGKPCDMGSGKSLMPALIDSDPFNFVALILASDGTFVVSASLEAKALAEFETDFTTQAVRFPGQDAALVLWNEGPTARPTPAEQGVYGAVVSSTGAVLASYAELATEAQLLAIDADWDVGFCWLSASEPSGTALLLIRLIEDVSGYRTPIMRRVAYSAGAISFPDTVQITIDEESNPGFDWALSVAPDGTIYVAVQMAAGTPTAEADVYELDADLAVVDTTRIGGGLNIATTGLNNPIVGLSVGWDGFLAFGPGSTIYEGTDYDPSVLRFGAAAAAETTCGAFLCEAFSDAFYVCEDCREDEAPDVWLPSTPQIPRRADTLEAARGADTLPEAAAEDVLEEIAIDDAAIIDLREAFVAGRIGALERALELARQDARDVEDVEIMMLAA